MDRLGALAQQIVRCDRCPRLAQWRCATARPGWVARPVPGWGDPEAAVLVVGLAPSLRGANAHGRMFTGDPSAQFLVSALWRCGLASQPRSTDRDDGLRLRSVWLSAALRCVPPANRPTSAELTACRSYLREELSVLNWRCAVALGSVAWSALQRALGLVPVAFRHGADRTLPDGRHLLASYHPSPQNTNTGRLHPAMLDAVLELATRYASSATTCVSPEASASR